MKRALAFLAETATISFKPLTLSYTRSPCNLLFIPIEKTCSRQPGRSPMMTFFRLAHMVDATQLLGWGGVGWGRDDDILWTWKHGGCYAHMVDATQLLGWGGVGWGRDDDILWTCTHGGCYTTAGVGWGGVRDDDIPWTWKHGGCYAHMVDATQLLGWGGVGWGRDDDILWTCTHGGCYATAGVGWGGVGSGWWHSLDLHTWWMLRNCWGGVGWGGVGLMTFFGLAHMVDATQLLGWGGVGWAGDDDILWTCTHGGCYATAGVGWVGKAVSGSLSNETLTLSPRDAFDYQKHGWLTGDVENASKLEEAEERTAWYEPCQEKKGPSAARAKVRVAANMFWAEPVCSCCFFLRSYFPLKYISVLWKGLWPFFLKFFLISNFF